MEWALINFRVRPQERRQLRIALLKQGMTLQDYFAAIVQRELENIRLGLSPSVPPRSIVAKEKEESHPMRRETVLSKHFGAWGKDEAIVRQTPMPDAAQGDDDV